MTLKSGADLRKILLIVEDEVLLAICLKDKLEDGGYRVLNLAIRH